MLDKIDVTPIVSDHMGGFYNFKTGRRSWSDIVLFFGLPILGVVFCVWRGMALSTNSVNAILTAFSIFAGLLFNLLVMVMTFLQTANGKNHSDLIAKKKILREVTATLSYAILIAIAIVTTAVVALSFAPVSIVYLNGYANAILIFGSIHFGLNLLMLLKRMYRLMQFEFDQHKFTNPGSRAA